jgi:nicotinamide-nucleotide amidase
MKIELVFIGTEVLRGQTENRNALTLSRYLGVLKWPIIRHTVVGDDKREISDVLKKALERSDVVIATGGLGPTLDDQTRKAVAELFSCNFAYSIEWASEIRSRYGEISSITDQATQPDVAKILPNPLGTAPGLLFTHQNKLLVLLPGVPSEMESIFFQEVVPLLEKRVSKHDLLTTEFLHFFLLRELEVDPLLRELVHQDPNLSIGIYPYCGLLTVSLSSATLASVSHSKARLLKAFGGFSFPSNSGKIEEVIHTEFKEKELTLSLAESCTGGEIAARLTKISGASEFFLGSIVAYNNELKKKILGVSEETLRREGAVSFSTVKEMAEGAIALTGSKYSLAVSGIAGPPNGLEDKPVGTLMAAISKGKGKTTTFSLKAYGNRSMIIDYAANGLLGCLYYYVKTGSLPSLP